MNKPEPSLPPEDFWSDWRSYFDSVADNGQAEAGTRYLSFTTPAYGICALPIEAVQTVAPPDGPLHRVPGRGGQGGCFLGLVAVRGQVQLVFDLTRHGCATDAAAPLPSAHLPKGEALIVVTGPMGRSAAFRVGAPLRLLQVDKREAALPTDVACPLAHLAEACFYEPGAAGEQTPVWIVRLPELLTELEAEARGA